MKDTELYREMARNLQHELSKEQERLEDRAKELNERMQLVDVATQLMDDNEKMSEENASLQRQLAEERQRRVELEMKLNEMNKLTAELGKKDSDEVLLKTIRSCVVGSKRKRAEKRAAIKEWALEMIMAKKLNVPEDLAEAIEHLDDEISEPKVFNINNCGQINDCHDNREVRLMG